MERYDIAIIGSGPAGISAAITAVARNKKIALFGKKELSSKVASAHQVNNYPGLPAISGADFMKAFQDHLAQMNIPIHEEQVAAVYAMGDYFMLQTSGGDVQADTVILATGVMQSQVLPGETDYIGRGVSYCATCDAMLYRGKRVAVLGYHEEAKEEAEFLAEVAQEVLYFPQKETTLPAGERIRVIDERVSTVVGDKLVKAVETKNGSYEVDGVFILRDALAPDQLVPGLQVADRHVAVNLQMETNIPGCFACGDICGTPYQYIKSAGQGNVAALSAVSYLSRKKRGAS